MQALAGMSTDRMIIILPTALVIMYLVISLQKYLSEKESPVPGLIIPVIGLIAATILAIRPFFVVETGVDSKLIFFCLRMWLVFMIPSIVLMFPYIRARKIRSVLEKEKTNTSEEDKAAKEREHHSA